MPTNANNPKVWAISDMHWSTKKPMDRYGYRWENHRERLTANWKQRISHHDLVLVPGDLSFAGSEVSGDLIHLNNLPGQKVFVPGNHDHWAQGQTTVKLRAFMSQYPTVHFLDHGRPYYETGSHLIVGYKGSEPPENPRFNQKHFNKTVEHAKNACEQASHVLASYHNVIVITHYPPSEKEREVMSELQPSLWLHGHAHVGGDDSELVKRWEFERSRPLQKCISSDYLDQVPIEVTGGVIRAHI